MACIDQLQPIAELTGVRRARLEARQKAYTIAISDGLPTVSPSWLRHPLLVATLCDHTLQEAPPAKPQAESQQTLMQSHEEPSS